MATRKQQKARRGRAQQHAARPKVQVAAELIDDTWWVNQGRHQGLDLTDREQLLDAAAVGLTVLCWRNTVLEDVHAGVEREHGLEGDGRDPNDPTVAEEERRARRAFDELLDSNWDRLAAADPTEQWRMNVLLDGRTEGFGIPDDIMMRLNISTAAQIRELLDDVLPEEVTEPGTVLPYDRRGMPDHVPDVVDLLHDPDREIVVGGAVVAAGDILGASWDTYTEDVFRKLAPHVTSCDRLGMRRGVWHIALSGVSYAGEWYPNPWWARAVHALEQAHRGGRTADVFAGVDRAQDIPAPFDAFWDTLRTAPATLNGPQCAWLQRTKLGANIRSVRDGDRDRLGPTGEPAFGGFAALF